MFSFLYSTYINLGAVGRRLGHTRGQNKVLAVLRAVTHIPVRGMDNKPMSSSILSGGVSSNKTEADRVPGAVPCVYICAVLPRVQAASLVK